MTRDLVVDALYVLAISAVLVAAWWWATNVS